MGRVTSSGLAGVELPAAAVVATVAVVPFAANARDNKQIGNQNPITSSNISGTELEPDKMKYYIWIPILNPGVIQLIYHTDSIMLQKNESRFDDIFKVFSACVGFFRKILQHVQSLLSKSQKCNSTYVIKCDDFPRIWQNAPAP